MRTYRDTAAARRVYAGFTREELGFIIPAVAFTVLWTGALIALAFGE